jgi:hypothetical protein
MYKTQKNKNKNKNKNKKEGGVIGERSSPRILSPHLFSHL